MLAIKLPADFAAISPVLSFNSMWWKKDVKIHKTIINGLWMVPLFVAGKSVKNIVSKSILQLYWCKKMLIMKLAADFWMILSFFLQYVRKKTIKNNRGVSVGVGQQYFG